MPEFILVSDFDGTITAHDFDALALKRGFITDAVTPWEEHRAGRLSHFDALQTTFSQIQVPENELSALIDMAEPDPQLATYIRKLREAGWRVVVASAGCDWYIRPILGKAGITIGPDGDLELHTNGGEYSPATGLRMIPPKDSPFYAPDNGVDKAAIVRFHQQRGATVAYAGDGNTDLAAALCVPPHLRFARGQLMQALQERSETARPFTRWADIAEALLGEQASS